MSKTNKISTVQHSHGISGYDFRTRTHFETQDRGANKIAVRLQSVRGPRRFMVVTGCSTHLGAFEIALQLAPVDSED
jgi:hypothetical protein